MALPTKAQRLGMSKPGYCLGHGGERNLPQEEVKPGFMLLETALPMGGVSEPQLSPAHLIPRPRLLDPDSSTQTNAALLPKGKTRSLRSPRKDQTPTQRPLDEIGFFFGPFSFYPKERGSSRKREVDKCEF